MSSSADIEKRALPVLVAASSRAYALVDSGRGRKLERYGRYVFDRPEPQALWSPLHSPDLWSKSDAIFKAEGDEDGEGGKWRTHSALPETWPVELCGVQLLCRLMNFRHLGLFPEQVPHWLWLIERVRATRGEPPRVLNLFAYTGAASLIAARAGAEVVHVDASRKAIGWAKDNQRASGLEAAPIRWIVEDARKFAAREVRRGRTYHIVLVDPPKFGRGPNGEVWDFFHDTPELLRECERLLAPSESALILTSYAIRASTIALDGLVREIMGTRRGEIESGELALAEEGSGRLLPTSLYTRWWSK